MRKCVYKMKDQSELALVKKEKQRFFSQYPCLGPISVISKETLLAYLLFFPYMLSTALPWRNLQLYYLVKNLKTCLSLSVCTRITSVSFTRPPFYRNTHETGLVLWEEELAVVGSLCGGWGQPRWWETGSPLWTQNSASMWPALESSLVLLTSGCTPPSDLECKRTEMGSVGSPISINLHLNSYVWMGKFRIIPLESTAI